MAPVPDAEPALGAVVVGLRHERRRVAREVRVLGLDEVLAEAVRLLRGERVRAQVGLEGRLVGGEVGELGVLAAGEAEELEERAGARPRRAVVERALVDARVVAEAVGRLAGDARVEAPGPAEEARVPGERAASRPPRAAPHLRLETAPVGGAHAREVDRAAVGRRAHARRPHAALDLDRVHDAREVAEVREVERLVLGVLQRHAVEGDVEAGRADPADVEVGVAGGEAGVGLEVDRGRRPQQERHLLAPVHQVDRVAPDVRLGDGRALLGADRLHHDLLAQADRAAVRGRRGWRRLRLRGGGDRVRPCPGATRARVARTPPPASWPRAPPAGNACASWSSWNRLPSPRSSARSDRDGSLGVPLFRAGFRSLSPSLRRFEPDQVPRV